jgi:hypothetical protein
VKPLYLRSYTARHRFLAPLALVGMMSAYPACAQDTGETKPASQNLLASAVIAFRERPKFPTDPQRLRRTVQVDGVLADGEWDAFYTVTEGTAKGVFYCNWDDNYLYLAARTESPAAIVFNVDAGGDGWLRNADNIEIVVGSVTEGSPLTVATRLLDAANSKDTPMWNDKSIPATTIVAAGKIVNNTQIIEVAIPKNTGSLVLRPGANIGLRADFLPAGNAADFKPTQPFEPHLLLDATLVEARAQSVPGLTPRLILTDDKCVAGQDLGATLELRNQTDQPIVISSVAWGGQGASASVLNTLKQVSVPPVPPLKGSKVTYKTVLPPDLAPGSYTLNVTAELPDGKQLQSSAAFQVVEPIQVQMSTEPNPVAIVGQTKMTINVDVLSAVMGGIRGEVELLTVPNGWELEKKIRRKPCSTSAQDRRTVTKFNVKLPSGTQAGDYPLEATVTYKGRVWRVKTVARVVRPEQAAPPPTVK